MREHRHRPEYQQTDFQRPLILLNQANWTSSEVNLKGRKSVWRVIVLRGDRSLHKLHKTIFTAFDRYDEHLYSFYFPKEPSGGDWRRLKVKEYRLHSTFRNLISSPNDSPLMQTRQGWTLSTSRSVKPLNTSLIWATIGVMRSKVVKIEPASRTRRRPIITERHGRSPPQYPDYDEEESKNLRRMGRNFDVSNGNSEGQQCFFNPS